MIKLKEMHEQNLDEKFVASEEVFHGRLLKVRRDQVVLPNGVATTRELIRHPGAVAIVPVLPDGSIVFEGDWNGEQIYRYTGSGDPSVINPAYGNDNSPTVLPDGRVVSLWLGREGGPGYHELKIMNADGGGDRMLLINVDISDTGIGSGE